MTDAPVGSAQLGQTHETVAYLARNWKFESISLHQRVSNEPVLVRDAGDTLE
jgi:hypothetical protein